MWFLTFGPPPVLLIFFTVSTTDPYLAVVIDLFNTAYPREDKEKDPTTVVLSSLLFYHPSLIFQFFSLFLWVEGVASAENVKPVKANCILLTWYSSS